MQSMNLLFRERDQDTWVPSADALCGLRRAIKTRAQVLFFFCVDPAAELDDLMTSIWLFTRGGGCVKRLSVASPHPSLSWIGPVRAYVIEHIFVTVLPNTDLCCRVKLNGMLEIPRSICPTLHVRTYQEGAISVCGNQYDCMVLGEHHFMDWCFRNWTACPRYVTAQRRLELAAVSSSAE